MQTKQGKHVEHRGHRWATRYTYDERVQCELRLVYQNGDFGDENTRADGMGFGDNESAALAAAIENLDDNAQNLDDNAQRRAGY